MPPSPILAVRATLRAAWKLEAKEGLRKLDQYASWLQRDWPDAAASVREGLDEIFTVNRLGLPAALRTCLTTTNIIDSTHSGIRQRTRRVTNWKNGEMALRWSAVAFVETETERGRFRRHRAVATATCFEDPNTGSSETLSHLSGPAPEDGRKNYRRSQAASDWC